MRGIKGTVQNCESILEIILPNMTILIQLNALNWEKCTVNEY